MEIAMGEMAMEIAYWRRWFWRSLWGRWLWRSLVGGDRYGDRLLEEIALELAGAVAGEGCGGKEGPHMTRAT